MGPEIRNLQEDGTEVGRLKDPIRDPICDTRRVFAVTYIMMLHTLEGHSVSSQGTTIPANPKNDVMNFERHDSKDEDSLNNRSDPTKQSLANGKSTLYTKTI